MSGGAIEASPEHALSRITIVTIRALDTPLDLREGR
jgi:hypothetical protein